MIKNFEEYINEDYFSKLANRKENGDKRKENEITEDFVREYIEKGHEEDYYIKSISFRKCNGETLVDIVGTFFLREDVEEIPFQFGKVTGNFVCTYCGKLTSLKGCPQEVGGNFNCVGCKKLSSLEGCPKKVGGSFKCSHCDGITSLEGCPEKVSGDFMCFGCYNLSSLKGCPKEVGDNFECDDCEKLTSLEGCPKEVGGHFRCYGCGKQFTETEVKSLCDVKGIIHV